jgi:hypothetical protein
VKDKTDKGKIIGILKSYPHKKRQIEQLRFELAHPAEIGADELIDALALAGKPAEEGGIRGGRVSDRTMAIAMRYRDMADGMNDDTTALIAGELRALEAETERIEHYVSLLGAGQASVIRRHYFDGVAWFELECELHMSRRSLFHCRDTALGELAAMYDFITKVKSADAGGETE